MAKKYQKQKKTAVVPPKAKSGPALFKRRPNVLFIGIIALLLIIFFHEAFLEGKVFSGADNVVSLVYEPYIEQAREQGITTFWNPYIFSGMPTWGSHVPGGEFAPILPPMLILKAYGVVQAIVNALPVPASFWDIFNYFLLGLFTYLYLLNRKIDRYAAFAAALSLVFALYTINWIMAGHNTKITVFSLIPAALLIIDKLFEKMNLLTLLLLVIVFHLQFNAAHLQIIFYSMMVIGFYFLFKLYEGEKLSSVLVVFGFTMLAGVFAFIMLSHNYFGMWEYKEFSIREAGSGGTDTGGKGGLDYDYATNWSFSPLEVITFFIPSFVGFGAPTYWGGMPFTESPIYMGIVISTLALIGVILRRKDKFVHFWIILGLFSLLLSFGKEFPLLYNFFFEHVPFFNNFRIPSMILCILVLCIAVLGAVGIEEVFTRTSAKIQKGKKPLESFFLRGLIAAGVLIILFFIGKGVYESAYLSMMRSSESRSLQLFEQVEEAIAAGQSAQIPPEFLNATASGVFGMAFRDTIVSLIFILLVAALLYGLAVRKVGRGLVQAGIALLLVIDWWIVDYKPMNMVTQREHRQTLQETDYVRFLKQDTEPFRVLPIQIHSEDNWFVAFGIQSIAGYHPAKLKLYDDVRNAMYNQFQIQDEEQFSRMNRTFLNVLNTKYVLTPFPINLPDFRPVFQGEQALVYENTKVLPRAFFVGNQVVIRDDREMFETINAPDYDPSATAYLSEPLDRPVAVPSEALEGTNIQFTEYGINGFSLVAETPIEAILKLSEVYYPSGWTATIDGKETTIHRTDYCLRAIVVPPGRHTITFSFEPRSYRTGLILTTVTNYLVGAVLLFYLVMFLRKRYFNRGTLRDKGE